MSPEQCPRREKTLAGICNCTYPGCPRRGLCCECLHHHRKLGQLPACFFPPEVEQTYDRTIQRFFQLHNS